MSDRIARAAAVSLSIATVVFATAVAAGSANHASPWAADTYSQMRLIAGSNAAAASVLRAGIEVTLQPGWKTYWRYPGDSGVPPRFDFAGSSNVKAVTVLWPAPQRFSDGAGNSIGYHDRVIFPLRVTPADAAKPALLQADVHYAVCEKLCVPAEGKAEISLGAGASPQDGVLAAAEAWVPQPEKLGADAPLAIAAVREDKSGARPRVIVEVTAPAGAKVDLFAEGPDPEWALPLPEQRPAAQPDRREFAFDLDGLPPDTKADGAELTLTLVGPRRAIAVKTHLD